MRSLLFMLLVACGGSKPAPAPVSNQPPPPPTAEVVPGKPMKPEPTQPNCANLDDMKCAIDTMQYFGDRMCSCKDKDCANKVNDDLTAWGTTMAKSAGAAKNQKPDPDLAKRAADIMTKYTECMTKVLMDAPPPENPCAGPDPCGG